MPAANPRIIDGFDFNVEACGECPVRSKCEGGRLIDRSVARMDDHIGDVADMTHEDATILTYVGETPHFNMETALRKYRQALERQSEMYTLHQEGLQAVLYGAVKAQKKSSVGDFPPSPRQAYLEQIRDEHSVFLEDLEDESGDNKIEPDDIEDIGASIAGWAGRGVCEAVEVEQLV